MIHIRVETALAAVRPWTMLKKIRSFQSHPRQKTEKYRFLPCIRPGEVRPRPRVVTMQQEESRHFGEVPPVVAVLVRESRPCSKTSCNRWPPVRDNSSIRVMEHRWKNTHKKILLSDDGASIERYIPNESATKTIKC